MAEAWAIVYGARAGIIELDGDHHRGRVRIAAGADRGQLELAWLSGRRKAACFQASCPLSSDPFIRWAYDGVGNRPSETRPAGVTTYAYNDADQLTSLTGPGGTVDYTYDDDGNQTAAGSKTFAYGLANRLTSTTSGSATATYTYDGDGRRLLASTGAQASQKTKYLWDPNWPLYQLALERNGAGNLRRRYVHGRDLVSMFTGGKADYYHHDGLGSTANLTSATGGQAVGLRLRALRDYSDRNQEQHERAHQPDAVYRTAVRLGHWAIPSADAAIRPDLGAVHYFRSACCPAA